MKTGVVSGSNQVLSQGSKGSQAKKPTTTDVMTGGSQQQPRLSSHATGLFGGGAFTTNIFSGDKANKPLNLFGGNTNNNPLLTPLLTNFNNPRPDIFGPGAQIQNIVLPTTTPQPPPTKIYTEETLLPEL